VSGKEVLDAACGVGYGLEILAAAGAAAVTGIDIDADVVAEAQRRFGQHAKEIMEGDLARLPFEDESFEVVVSFETIEHVDEPERALAEMHRVLRPEGLLIISSPNPEVYLGDNEHHVREFRPEELAEKIRVHFGQVALYRQDAWVGSSIQPAAGESAVEETLQTSHADGGPAYGIVVAGEGPLPHLGRILAFGEPFDVRWWSEQLAHSKGKTAALVEREAAIQRRLVEAETALLEANQELAQLPVLRHSLSELQQVHADLSERYHAILGSTSWRLTEPLRRIRRRGG